MNPKLKGKHVLCTLGINQSLIADAIADRVLSAYATHVEHVYDVEHAKLHICVDKVDVHKNKKNKQLAHDMQHFCHGISAFLSAFNS